MTISVRDTGSPNRLDQGWKEEQRCISICTGLCFEIEAPFMGCQAKWNRCGGVLPLPSQERFLQQWKKRCAVNSRRAGWTAWPLWPSQGSHSEVFSLHIVEQSARSSLCGPLLLVMWQFPARDISLAFGFLHGAVINASMLRVVTVLAEEDVFVLFHSPLVWCLSLPFPYVWLAGMHLYLASVLLTFKESSKLRLLHLYRECQLQRASSTMKTWSRTFLSLKMRNILLNI